MESTRNVPPHKNRHHCGHQQLQHKHNSSHSSASLSAQCTAPARVARVTAHVLVRKSCSSFVLHLTDRHPCAHSARGRPCARWESPVCGVCAQRPPAQKQTPLWTPAAKHAQQWSLSHSLTLSLSHSLTLSLSHSLTLSLSHSLTLSLSHSLSLTLSLCHSVTLSLCHSVTLSLCHSVTLSLCHSLTLSLSHSLTLSLTRARQHT